MTDAIARMDETLAAAAGAGDVPGAIATVVDADGVLFEGAGGRVSVDGGTEATTDTVCWIASMTKAMATAGVLQLVERGEIDLDAAVASYLPEFGELEVLDGFEGDEPRLRPAQGAATVRQLLDHTAGLGYQFLNPDLLRWIELTGNPGPLSGDPEFLKAPLMSDPGTAWEYGTNVDWAGRVLEEVAGTTLDAYLAEHLFEPLGMSDTTFRPTTEQRGRLMPIHRRQADGTLVATDEGPPPDPQLACAGHGCYGTARDYGRFLRALLRGGELDGARILREETVELALSPHLGSIRLPDFIPTADPEISNDVTPLPVRRDWGLGFELVMEDLPGMRRAGTGAWAGLSNCYFWVDRAGGRAGVFLTQLLPFFDERVINRCVELEMAAYADVAESAPA